MAEKKNLMIIEETGEKRVSAKQESEQGEIRPDFIAVWERFGALDKASRAGFRHVASPDDLLKIAPAYRLIPKEESLHGGWRRVLFLAPYVTHAENRSLGAALAVKIKEARLFQMLRSGTPMDLIQLRRVCLFASPRADWQMVGEILFYWSEEKKTRLLEDYFNALRREKGERGQNGKKEEKFLECPCPHLTQCQLPKSRRHGYAKVHDLWRCASG
jgi:CRISPR system Cascade subunit CasB